MYVQMCAIREGQSTEKKKKRRKEKYVLYVDASTVSFFVYVCVK
jgi:hypothetical protein